MLKQASFFRLYAAIAAVLLVGITPLNLGLAASGPLFSTGLPSVSVEEPNTLLLALPLANNGSEDASNVLLTSITLNAVAGLTPAVFPVALGNLAVNSNVIVQASFDSGALLGNTAYLLTAKGTYDFGGTTYGFTVNRYLRPPPQITCLAQSTSGLCYEGCSQVCPNGLPADSNGNCPAFCPDGSPARNGECRATCPFNQQPNAQGYCPSLCQNGSPPGSQGNCPAFPCMGSPGPAGTCAITCADGSTPDNQGKCPTWCQDLSIPSSSNGCPIVCPYTIYPNEDGTCADPCSTDITPAGGCPYLCPNGQPPNSLGECVASCPSGTIAVNGTCSAWCLDGSTPDPNGRCPALCPYNEPTPAMSACLAACGDGGLPDQNGNCPATCADGSTGPCPLICEMGGPPVNGMCGAVCPDFESPNGDGTCAAHFCDAVDCAAGNVCDVRTGLCVAAGPGSSATPSAVLPKAPVTVEFYGSAVSGSDQRAATAAFTNFTADTNTPGWVNPDDAGKIKKLTVGGFTSGPVDLDGNLMKSFYQNSFYHAFTSPGACGNGSPPNELIIDFQFLADIGEFPPTAKVSAKGEIVKWRQEGNGNAIRWVPVRTQLTKDEAIAYAERLQYVTNSIIGAYKPPATPKVAPQIKILGTPQCYTMISQFLAAMAAVATRVVQASTECFGENGTGAGCLRANLNLGSAAIFAAEVGFNYYCSCTLDDSVQPPQEWPACKLFKPKNQQPPAPPVPAPIPGNKL